MLFMCVVWYGVVWCGVVWCGVVWCGAVRCGAARRGAAWVLGKYYGQRRDLSDVCYMLQGELRGEALS